MKLRITFYSKSGSFWPCCSFWCFSMKDSCCSKIVLVVLPSYGVQFACCFSQIHSLFVNWTLLAGNLYRTFDFLHSPPFPLPSLQAWQSKLEQAPVNVGLVFCNSHLTIAPPLSTILNFSSGWAPSSATALSMWSNSLPGVDGMIMGAIQCVTMGFKMLGKYCK